MARRFGSAMISNTDSTPLIYSTRHIRVKAYTRTIRDHRCKFQDLSYQELPWHCVGFHGGYAAISFGVTHPDVFGAVYALHPVGTGSGLQTMRMDSYQWSF